MRLDDLGIYKKGPFGSSLTKSMFIPKGKNTIKVYEQKNAIKKDCNLGDYYISEDYFLSKMTSFEVFPHDVIVSCAGTIGETFIMPSNIERGIINQALMKMTITREIDIEYFLIYFDFILKDNAKKYSAGSAIKNIPPFEILKALFVALPPLNEQKRIVAKLEEILPFIDEYNKKEQKLTALNQQFPEQLKKSILQAAIQGKLVEQDPNDKPATEIIKHIQAEKERLISEKKIKKPKVKSEIVVRDNLPYEIVDGVERCIADEVPFEIPESWMWVRLGNISIVNGGFAFKSQNFSDKGNLVVRISDFNNSGFVFKNPVRHSYDSNLENYLIKFNDILIAMTGGTVGKSYFVKYMPEEKLLLNQRVAAVRCLEIYPDYINVILESAYIKDKINSIKNSTNDNISMEDLNNFLLSIPPLNEQKRIVQKIEELFSHIEYL